MAGSIIENMSSRKLSYVLAFLSSILVFCFLLGALVSPSPNSSMQYLATKCVDPSAGKDPDMWFWPRGKGACKRIDKFTDAEAARDQLTADHIVFAFQMPLPRNKVAIDYSRWQQNLIGVLSMDIEYEDGVDHDSRVHLLLNSRLGYKNKGEAPDTWHEYASSFVHRNLDCEIDEDKKKDGYYYNCSIMPLFELGSLHHDYYLVNLRIPSAYDYDGHEISINGELGKLVDLWLVAIHQNGGFTKVWLTLKTCFFAAIIGELYWFKRRLRLLPRESTLLEKILFQLGLSLTLLNVPMEYLTLSLDMPWINLFNDVKQGIFYASIMIFWLVFTGEHLINDDSDTTGEKRGFLAYWKNISVILFGFTCLFIFDMCERGVQLRNPFYSIWVTDLGTNLSLGFITLAGLSFGIYFMFLSYLIYKAFRTISQKEAAISAMSRVRRIHYQGLIWRFRFLMIATLVTAAMTAIEFIVRQVAEGQYKWDEDITITYTSGLMAGVYGLWNIYIIGILFLYAPSHKQWPDQNAPNSDDQPANTGEEIEFSVSSVSGAPEASELSSLTDFIRHQATD